jgi:hypothetical protein
MMTLIIDRWRFGEEQRFMPPEERNIDFRNTQTVLNGDLSENDEWE